MKSHGDIQELPFCNSKYCLHICVTCYKQPCLKVCKTIYYQDNSRAVNDLFCNFQYTHGGGGGGHGGGGTKIIIPSCTADPLI